MAQRQTFRLATKKEARRELWELLVKNFPAGEPLDHKIPFEEEFPLLLAPGNGSHSIFVLEGQKVLAHVAYRPFYFMLPGFAKPFVAAGVGLVTCHPDYRKQGLARELLNYVEKEARIEGAQLAVLWTAEHEFFNRQGYLLAGTELHWKLSRDKMKSLPRGDGFENFDVRPLKSFAEIMPFYSKQNLGPQRPDIADYDKFLKMPNTFCLGAFQGALLRAYAFMGKGRDLRDTIHEVGGNPAALVPLLHACADKAGETMHVSLPPTSPFREIFERDFGVTGKVAHAYFKVLDAPQIINRIAHADYLPNGVELQATEPEGFAITKKGEKLFETIDPGHLLQLFFGPWSTAEMEGLPAPLIEALKGMRPLPLYFWGFDSV